MASYKHYRTCNLCEAMCGIEIEVEGKEVKSIRGDQKDPFSRGHICPKALGLKDIYEDKNRLKHPVRRTENGWERISWEAAYDEVASRLKDVQEQYGNNAVGIYLGNPTVHNFGSLLFFKGVIKALKSQNLYSATSVDQLPHHLAGWAMFGHLGLMPIPDIDHTDYMIIMGGNPMVSNGSIMSVPDFGNRLKAVRKRGKVVVIDPRRTETARKSDEHIFVKPGRDVLLLMAMVQQIFEHDWVNLRHLEKHIAPDQLDELKAFSKDYTPEKVAPLTGIDAATIKRLTKEYCETEKAVLYGRLGVSVVEYGGLSQWLVNVINILTGHFDTAGGAMFSLPAFDNIGGQKQRPKFDRWKSRVRNLPEMNGELPVATLAEEILTEGKGQVKAMFVHAGNPVLSTPNGQQLDKAFESLDFMVCMDIYINETTRHANIILPPATGLEVSHYDLGLLPLAIRNNAKYSEPLFEKDKEGKYDYEIILALQQRLETQLPKDHSKYEAQQQFYKATPELFLDMALKKGPYDLSLEKLKANPHGIDLGALKTQLPDRLCTEEKMLNLVPDIFAKDLDRLRTNLVEKATQDELLLIGRRSLRSNNSWMHNSYRLVKGRNQCTMLIHPTDAQHRNIENGQEVEVTSRVGSVKIEAEISDEIMEGVISIPHGWGHGRKGVQLDVAQAHAGVSVNDLTDDLFIDSLTGNAALNGVPVFVR